jgi:hypothetical protein
MTIIGTAGPTHGITSNESGILIKTFNVSMEPEFTDPLTNKIGERINEARGAICAKISIAGEVNATVGLIDATFYAAVTLVNIIGVTGAMENGLLPLSAGGVYMNSAKIDESATGWKTFSAEYQQFGGIA